MHHDTKQRQAISVSAARAVGGTTPALESSKLPTRRSQAGPPRPQHLLLLVLVVASLSGCGDSGGAPQADSRVDDPCPVVLVRHSGQDGIDTEIRRLQGDVADAAQREAKLERLGWLFVSKARSTHDTGYFTLAEQAARCLERSRPASPAALLLRGHVLHNLHRFKEAEALARRLVAQRERPFDYGLLGDALMEQGRLGEAVDAYQRMVDLKPGFHAYSRIAHVRWLRGDLEGARRIMRMAVRAVSPRDSESAAWAYSRLALYELQAGATDKALQATEMALAFHNNYAPALLAQGRILLAKGQPSEAPEALSRAAELNPLPEYQWVLAEALHAAGRADDAEPVETRLKVRGAVDDPRTLALYLATRREQPQTALRLAREELEQRADPLTLDALAWSLRAAGKPGKARAAMNQALVEGTADARLYFHAAVIAAEAGETQEAARWADKAFGARWMLLPSERQQLLAARSSLLGASQAFDKPELHNQT